MSERPKVTIDGKTHELVWGNLARVRYSGIPAEVRAAGGVVPMATMIWAAFAAKPHPYATWEHLAEFITPENMAELSAALEAALPKAQDDEKKNTCENLAGPSSTSA